MIFLNLMTLYLRQIGVKATVFGVEIEKLKEP
jgi:hypothetical protein